MLSHDPRPRGRADADAARTRIARRLQRYAPAVQAAVQKAARGHPRVADLALSFPALLFALAVPRREADAARAHAAAIEGRALADVAQAAGVPLWLRKLPVDALTKPLPYLPDGDLFRRRIVNHLPRSPKLAPLWLDTVAFAAQWAHEPFAIWIARELTRGAKDIKRDQLRMLCLWAWFSLHPGTVGHRLIAKPWQPALRFKTALDGAWAWHSRAGLHINLGESPIADTWLTPGRVYGYQFVPLRCADDIVAEAAAMKNCLNTYGYNLAHNRSRLWSVRMNGRRVATLRLARRRRASSVAFELPQEATTVPVASRFAKPPSPFGGRDKKEFTLSKTHPPYRARGTSSFSAAKFSLAPSSRSTMVSTSTMLAPSSRSAATA